MQKNSEPKYPYIVTLDGERYGGAYGTERSEEIGAYFYADSYMEEPFIGDGWWSGADELGKTERFGDGRFTRDDYRDW